MPCRGRCRAYFNRYREMDGSCWLVLCCRSIAPVPPNRDASPAEDTGMPKTRRIIVVGAGLGGLAATVGLRRRGFEVEVYEQSPALGEIGAGINITPNGAKVLNAFGLGDEARRLGNIGSELTMCDMKTDARLFGFAWSEFEARYGQPQYQFHRADLLGLLQRAVPESIIHLGARCVGVSTTDTSAAITLENGRQLE